MREQIVELTEIELLEEEARMHEAHEAFKREMSARLQAFGGRLQDLAEEQVGQRREIENRWLEDIRQFSGKYDSATLSSIQAAKGSQAYVNITRSKCNSAEARLSDMLFPTDDRNWEILPTPVPELAESLNDQKQATTPDGAPVFTPEGAPVQNRDMASGILEVAKERSRAMQDEMDDQLTEARYNIKCREVIKDAVRLGTGILKGPVVVGRTKRSWRPMDDGAGNQIHVIEVREDIRPSVERVDPWNFFPDMSGAALEDAEFIFQRHLMGKKDLRALVKREGFLVDQIREVIEQEEPLYQNTASHINDLRSINGVSARREGRYEVWEYHGPINKEDLRAAGCECSEDALDEVEGIVWFVDGRVIKAAINPMESEARPYSVYSWEKDDSSIFGFGIPYLMRNAQRAINGAWRMSLDNAGLSVGPQIVVNPHVIKPADGDWNLAPKKVWQMTDRNRSVHEAFGSFEINSHLGELQAILQTAKSLADEETNLPVIAQGEQGQYTRTATGMSLLMNSANVVTRRSVKNFDDDVTRTFLTRLYDWNMQNNEKPEIKGDYFVDARGSSALLAKETQAQNLIQLMSIAPQYAGIIKIPELVRKTVQSMQLDAVALVASDEEVAQQQQSAQEQPQVSPEQEKLQMQTQIEQLKAQVAQEKNQIELMKIQSDRELALAGMAADRDMKVTELQAKLGLEQMRAGTKHDLFNKEAQLKLATGQGI